ncbi:hypothetical protein [Mucilaginibacter sp. CSA2-8R]|uniref:hypothetical protein n=1 Tax=Mucilaginibacter sp. CSA2-8R TaxID=3141542 RepID=UPI00315C6728
MNIFRPSIKLVLPALMLNTFFVSAQKLPNVQTASIYAPTDIKINGNTNEWNNKFQAYNKAVEIYYTLSNDDKNLYLTAKAKEREIIDKIIRGGISLIISRENDKKSKNTLSVTYPVLEGPAMWEVADKFARQSINYKNKETLNINDLNTAFAKREKLIGVTGVAAIPDSAISVYNSDGIKTAFLFDDKLTYTYELAVPIKYLNLPGNSGGKFSYQIKINPDPGFKKPIVITANMPPPPPPVMEGTLATTDFKGRYTLAKKP